MGHRPLYCSSTGGWLTSQLGPNNDCIYYAVYLRSRLEDIFYKYRVDLVLGGHRHDYERTLPVYRGVPEQNYISPRAPVYVVNGAAGNRETQDGQWIEPTPTWSVSRNAFLGYGTLQVFQNQIVWTFFNDSNNVVLDTFTLVKSQSVDVELAE